MNKDNTFRSHDSNPSLVTSEYESYFKEAGLKQLASVAITEKLDKSVRFIGAPISVMKPILMEDRIPQSGLFMIQNCIRTANVSGLLDVETTPEYGSFFTAMCALTSYDQLGNLFEQTGVYLTDKLGINTEDLYISLDKKDSDLFHASKRFGDIAVIPTLNQGHIMTMYMG